MNFKNIPKATKTITITILTIAVLLGYGSLTDKQIEETATQVESYSVEAIEICQELGNCKDLTTEEE